MPDKKENTIKNKFKVNYQTIEKDFSGFWMKLCMLKCAYNNLN